MTPLRGRVKVMITPSEGMVETGGEQDPFRSLNVQVLIKTSIFRG